MINAGFKNRWKTQISLSDYMMGRDMLYPKEWELVKENAEKFLERLNAFLCEAFPDHAFFVESGWRPAKINATTKGASVNSWHIKGLAIDLNDKGGFLRENLRPEINPGQAELLRRYGLFMEDIAHTPTWIHLDSGNRPDRPSRIFKP